MNKKIEEDFFTRFFHVIGKNNCGHQLQEILLAATCTEDSSTNCYCNFTKLIHHFTTNEKCFFVSCKQELIDWSIRHKLIKFTPIVDFTNILRAAFAPFSLCQKTTNPNCMYKKAAKNTFIRKSSV